MKDKDIEEKFRMGESGESLLPNLERVRALEKNLRDFYHSFPEAIPESRSGM